SAGDSRDTRGAARAHYPTRRAEPTIDALLDDDRALEARIRRTWRRGNDRGLEELPRDVEPEEPVVGVGGAEGDLSERRPEPVPEIELERVAADPPLDAEADEIDARVVPRDTRRDFSDDVRARPDTHPAAQPDDHRVVVGLALRLQRIRVEDVDRLGVHHRKLLEPLREQQSDGGGQLVLHVVRALERRDDVDAQRAPVRLLLPDAVLPEDLDRAIARPVHADLRARKQAVAQLEADLRA